jgi:hypothetical protein
VLDVQLVRVEKKRGAGKRRDPPAGTEPEHERVDQNGDGEAEQMLDERDDREIAFEGKQREEAGIADGPAGRRLERGALFEVKARVGAEQRRLVSKEHHCPKRDTRGEEEREEPVPAQKSRTRRKSPAGTDGRGRVTRRCLRGHPAGA